MGDGFGFGGFDLDPGLGVLEGLIGSLIAALTYLWNVLVAIAQYLYSLLLVIAQAVVQFLEAAERLMVHLFETLYTDIIKPLIDELVKLEQWVNKVLSPVLKIIRRIQAWYNKYILPYQKLALQIISKVRQFLAIFRVFGVKWAQKLDADLAKIQTYITASIVDVIATLNTLTSWIQLISDPTQILRKAFWQNTAFTGVSEIFKAANIGALKPVSAADKAQGQANLGLLNPATPPVTAGPNNTAVLSPTMQDIQAKMMAALPDYNPTVGGYTGPVQA